MWTEDGWTDWTRQLPNYGSASSSYSEDFTQDLETSDNMSAQSETRTQVKRPLSQLNAISPQNEELSIPPTFIDVGLHAAALSPGSYRQYVADRIRQKPKKTLSAAINNIAVTLQKIEDTSSLTPDPKPCKSQFPITIPHAGGDLIVRPLKRRGQAEIEICAAKRSKYSDLSKRIILKVQESASKCSVSWPSLSDGSSNFKQQITILANANVVASTELDEEVTSFEFNTDPGQAYEISLVISNEAGEIMAKGKIECKAVFSLAEMDLLMCRALTCTGTRMQSFIYVYRCKPKVYWNDISYRRNGIMEKYIKDNNGQAASPVNAEIYGLFFTARSLSDGSMVTTSPFGDFRMKIPAKKLLDPERVNYYFSDYYCNRLAHYVTVVICENGSETDDYCREKLVQLDPEDNPFLMVQKSENSDPQSPYTFFVNNKTWVEIYYTENVPMNYGTFEKIQATGAGSSSVGGLPQNKACITCNLYPVTSKAKRSLENSTEQGNTSAPQITISPLTLRAKYPSTGKLAEKSKRECRIDSPDSSLEQLAEVTDVLRNLVDQVVRAEITSILDSFKMVSGIERELTSAAIIQCFPTYKNYSPNKSSVMNEFDSSAKNCLSKALLVATNLIALRDNHKSVVSNNKFIHEDSATAHSTTLQKLEVLLKVVDEDFSKLNFYLDFLLRSM
ncbi:phytanoyl-CoA hydroxylase-interacting protein-like [Ditylenchus destructor]|nr:phytanoyl-CoA hydroxylase-interacting protein-like [Ditylenchus destructor]